MRLKHWRRISLVMVGVTIVIAGLSAQSGPAKDQEPDVLAALLTEVRGLRAAMEQMASAGPRVQLALGRLQLQEQRINGMARRHESVRDALASRHREAASVRRQLEGVVKAIQERVTDPDERRAVEDMAPTLKQSLAAALADVQRLQAEEALLQQQIAEEQGRWSDINRALEELERSLARR